MRAALVVVTFAAALASGSPSGSAQPATNAPSAPPRVAIVVEVAVGVDAARANALTAALAAALNTQLVVDARGGAAVVERLPPGGLPDGCLADPNCVIDVARRLEVDGVLFVALVQLGDELQIDSSWLDAGGSTVVARPRFSLRGGDDVEVAFRGRAVTLLPEAALRTAPTKAPPASAAASPGRRMTTTSWALAGIGGVGLGAGLGLGLWTRSSFLTCERDGCDDEGRRAVRTRGLLADASSAIGAAALIAGAVVYLRSKPRAASVRVDVDDRGAAVVVGGRF